MTLAELAEYTVRLIEILSIKDDHHRDVRLANLMTDLETAYSIPMLIDEKYNEENQLIIGFYRMVSNLRRF